MSEVSRPLVGPEKDAYEAASKRRIDFATNVIERWKAYLKEEGVADAAGNATSTHDRLLRLAIDLIDHVRALEYRGPLQEVKFGDIPGQRRNALQSISSFTNFDQVIEWTSKEPRQGKAITVHPIDLLLGELVRRARSLGASWKEIGTSMGITSQGAQKKAREKGWVEESEVLTETEE